MSDWLTWQIVDSAFPTGLFAHSWGLESAWQHGEVEDGDTVYEFLDAVLVQTGQSVVPLLNDGYRSPDALEALDDLADAFLTNPVANRASRVQGRTLAATASRIWPSPALATLQRRADRTRAHVAPLSGAIFHTVGLPLSTLQRATLYATARGVLSAAVRLGILGAFEAQRIQASCAARLQEIAERSAELTAIDLAQTAPAIDLLQSRHDRLYSRLFQS